MWDESLKDAARRLRDKIEAARSERAARAAALEQRIDAEWSSVVISIQDRANQINAEMPRQFLRVDTPGDQFTIEADICGGREWTFLLNKNGAISIDAINATGQTMELFARIVKDGDGFAFAYGNKQIDARDLSAAILSEFLDPKSVWGQ